MTAMNVIEISTRYGREERSGRRERRGAGRDGHGDGEDVVGEERDAGELRGQDAEVVARHHVRAARRRVGLDRLAVRQDQEPEHDEQGNRDRNDEHERGQADERQQVAQDLLGRVRRGRQIVGGEDRRARSACRAADARAPRCASGAPRSLFFSR